MIFLLKDSRVISTSEMIHSGFTATRVIDAYRHYSCELEPFSWRGVLETTLCDKVCQ